MAFLYIIERITEDGESFDPNEWAEYNPRLNHWQIAPEPDIIEAIYLEACLEELQQDCPGYKFRIWKSETI